MTFDIEAKHPDYLRFAPSWQLMRDAVGGDDDVKAAGQAYLPMKTADAAVQDVTEQARLYAAYMLRAEFPEIVAPTITGHVGLICAQSPTIKLPSRMEGLRERATLDGLTLDDLIARVVAELLITGRYGLLPSFDAGEPYLAGYCAESIINWDAERSTLSFVVLDESGLVRNAATNAWGRRKQFRLLQLIDGALESIEWSDAAGTLAPMAPEQFARSATAPRPVDFMPLVILGTRNLTAEPDDVPLYGLAKTAVRIYRLDADYQQALHMTSEPTPWVSGWDDPAGAMREGKVPMAIGAANLWVLPNGGEAGFLEFSGPGLEAQRKAIDAEREAAATYGARMFDAAGSAPESGESRKVRYGQTTASLKTIAKVACAGVERALRNQAQWMGLNPDDVSVSPNLDWVTDAMSPAELTALVKAWQDGAISYPTLFERLKAGKVVSAEREMDEETAAILDDPVRGQLPSGVDPMAPDSGLLPPTQRTAAA